MRKLIIRYKFFLIMIIFTLIIFMINHDIGINVLNTAFSSLLQMLTVVPPIMIMLGLMDVWIPREKFMKHMGESSGISGILITILIASIAAGPMYAAFPFIPVLMRKGVKFSNILLFMNAWCVTKISTLLFEISGIGITFTFWRFVIDLPGVIIISLITEKMMKKDEIDNLYALAENL